jgi:tetratricopeptide (TPR) repeat protein
MLALWLSVALLQEPQKTAKPAEIAATAQARDEAVLERDPRKLPLAAADRWLAWKPDSAVPDALKPALAEGMRAYSDADYTRALASLFAVLEREPDYPPALYQAGTTYFRLRRYRDCIVMLERFAHAAPSQVGATQALGHCYYTLGDYGKARAQYEAVIAAAPQSVEAWRGLGLTHMRLGDDVRALECLDKALELRPDHADALSARAQILFEQGHGEEALVSAAKARDLAPFEPRHWFLLSEIYGDLGRDTEAGAARARFTELSRIQQEILAQEGLLLHEPRSVDALRRLVGLQRTAGNLAEMRVALRRLLALTPTELPSYALALESLHALGDSAGAKQTAAEIEQRFADDADAWKVIAQYCAANGDAEGQKRAAARIVQLTGARK